MPQLKLVMLGTGEFAVPTFQALYETPHAVVGLFTQPDRTGRGHHSHVNPMKQLAVERGTPVFQPANVNLPASLLDLRNLDADVFVVAAYGQILSPELLAIPRLAAINVHASLLPKYRGAAPVAYAILKGERETGVSIIQVLPQLDAGPILAVARTPIGPEETAGELEDRLAQLAVPLLAPVLDQLATNSVHAIPQQADQVSRAPKLKKEMGCIDWNQSAAAVDCQVRAMQPWPNPYSFLHAANRPPQRILILSVRPRPAVAPSMPPGAIIRADNQGLIVQTGDQPVEIVRLQPEGKRPMSAIDFLRGNPLSPGDRFGGTG